MKKTRGRKYRETIPFRGEGEKAFRAYRTTGQKLTHRYLLEGLKSSGGSPGGKGVPPNPQDASVPQGGKSREKSQQKLGRHPGEPRNEASEPKAGRELVHTEQLRPGAEAIGGQN